MDAQSLASDKGKICQTLFIQFHNTILFLLGNTSINNHGVIEDTFSQMTFSFSQFLLTAQGGLSCAFDEFIEGDLLLVQFRTLFVDYHQNVLLLLTEMYGDSIDRVYIAEVSMTLDVRYSGILSLLKGIAKYNLEIHYDCLKVAFKAYLQITDGVIESIPEINPQDIKVDDNKYMDLDNRNNNHGNIIVVYNDQTEGKEKILKFFWENLFKRANSVINLYGAVKGVDKQALYNEFNAWYRASSAGTGKPADGFIRPQGEDDSDSYEYTGHTVQTTVARILPSGFYGASGDKHGNIHVWHTQGEEYKQIYKYKFLAGAVKDLDWDTDSKRIVVVGEGTSVNAHVFIFDSGKQCWKYIGATKTTCAYLFCKSRSFRIVTGSEDYQAIVNEGPPFKIDTGMTCHQSFVNDVRYSPSGDQFVTVGADKVIILYKGKTREKIREIGNGVA
ncbi:WD repeat-containing protein 1 [Mycoemilia scoparia]|uniref:WD repeat-containing protein 1 n=1 Tax=Mycoemilia scoparia TaxID=417184 RepID=A0A9W8DP45_9FUNG|nr:WD repeat-containing protein 1 [Mycoemilia scoparia]